jgi:hypothetical protein
MLKQKASSDAHLPSALAQRTFTMATETSDALPQQPAAGEETQRLREQLKEAADRTAALEAQVLDLEQERRAGLHKQNELRYVFCPSAFIPFSLTDTTQEDSRGPFHTSSTARGAEKTESEEGGAPGGSHRVAS